MHQLWFVDGEYLTCAAGAADFTPRNQQDDQVFLIVDVRDPAPPEEVGRWWFPIPVKAMPQPPVVRHPRFDTGLRAHNTNVYPARPDRAYLGYIDGGAIILDIADKARPKMVSHRNPHPPFNGFTHTVMPLFDRGLLVVTDEIDRTRPGRGLAQAGVDRRRARRAEAGPHRDPAHAAWCYKFGLKGGRYGAHNIHDNRPGPAFHSEEIIVRLLTAASGSITSPTRSSRRRSRATCRKRPKARRRVGADQRRLRRRERDRVRRRPPHRRPVRARDEPLIPGRARGWPAARPGAVIMPWTRPLKAPAQPALCHVPVVDLAARPHQHARARQHVGVELLQEPMRCATPVM